MSGELDLDLGLEGSQEHKKKGKKSKGRNKKQKRKVSVNRSFLFYLTCIKCFFFFSTFELGSPTEKKEKKKTQIGPGNTEV